MHALSLATPLLRQAYAYWSFKRGDRPLPARTDLDPADIPRLLPHVVLLDVLRAAAGAPLDFRYRLIGTLVDAHSLGRYTGRCVSAIPHQRPPSQLWRNFATVAESRLPIATNIEYVGPHRDFLGVADLVMPLAADGATVDMLFIVIDYLPQRRPRPAD